MKLSLAWLIFFLGSIQCYVTNNVKYADATTKLPFDESVPVIKFSGYPEGSDSGEHSNYVYLDDVVAGLVLQNWTNEEKPCLNQTLNLIRSLQNFTLWAVWEWDSVSSQPTGILSGNRYQLGNFDQCMRSPWTTSNPEVMTQYCLAEVTLKTDDQAKKKRLDETGPYSNALDYIQHRTPYVRPIKYLTWGACVPASCQARSVERLVGAVLARSHLGAAGLRPHIQVTEACQRADRPREYDALFYGFIGLVATLFFMCLACTIINVKSSEPQRHGLKYEICKAFCLKENCQELLRVKSDGLETIYGIRYITICLIPMCHLAGMINAGPISNGIKVDNSIFSAIGMFLMHNDVFVDTFFFISGFLLAKIIMAMDKLPNIFVFIVKRYLRLAVALAVVVFYISAVFPHTGSGPLWDRFVEEETGTCRRNWWLNLLMISNYVRTDRACLVVSWYIPCDFHFFTLTVLTCAIYRRWRRLGIVCAGALTIASVVTPGVVNYIYELAAIQLFTFDFISNPRSNQQFQLTYIKSHTRATSYIIGFFAGWYFIRMKNKLKLSQTRAVLGAWSGVAIMLLVMLSGTSYLWRSYSNLEGAFYAALNRPAWAIGIALLILCCSFGKVPLLRGFLSWYPWVPLSRLAYGLYLTHTVVIIRNVGIARNSVYYDHFSVFMASVSVIVISTVAALIIWLLAEAPVNNLFMICVKPRRRSNQGTSVGSVSSNETGQSGVKGNTNRGYLQENLPENINVSSKM